MKTSNNFPNKTIVEALRSKYPPSCRVELVSIDDPFSKLKLGDQGTVTDIDSTGTVFVNWYCGSNLGIVYGVDQIRKV